MLLLAVVAFAVAIVVVVVGAVHVLVCELIIVVVVFGCLFIARLISAMSIIPVMLFCVV